MRSRAWLLALALWPLACTTSTSHQEVSTSTGMETMASASVTTDEMVRGINAFASDLYRPLGDAPGNVIFSPLSISVALGSVYAGAAGNTRTEMRKVLHLPAGAAPVYEAYRSLFERLESRATAGGAEWTLANRAWVAKGDRLLPEFVATTKDKFGADVGEADFAGAPEPSRAAINEWVETKTKKRIQDLFPQGSIDHQTAFVLANAIYFKGKWRTQFDAKETRRAPFHISATGTKQLPMMNLTRDLAWAHIAGARLLELPYREEQLSMLVVLPNEIDGLSTSERALSADTLRTWVSALSRGKVHVGLPRFKATRNFDLNDILSILGMKDAFQGKSADFSGITGKRNLSIGKVIHKAFVEVNEEGTEAAAATGVLMTRGTMTEKPPEQFIVDRPFLFLIRDRDTGCVLFLGRVVDPTL